MLFQNLFDKLGFTDKWQVRCPNCGRTKTLEEVGGKRTAARCSAAKFTLGHCSQCNSLKWLVIEPQPETAEANQAE